MSTDETMNEESREHLSCLMDGEISRETGRFLVRRLGADRELCATWARYHLVRDCLRHQQGGLASGDLSLRVREAIAREGRPAAHNRFPVWGKRLTGLAVAASVALMAIVAVGPGNQPENRSPGDLANAPVAPSFITPQGLAPIPMTQQASLNGATADDNRMNAYLLRHYQATGSTGGRGFVTFVPIVITPAVAEPQEPSGATGKESVEETVAERR